MDHVGLEGEERDFVLGALGSRGPAVTRGRAAATAGVGRPNWGHMESNWRLGGWTGGWRQHPGRRGEYRRGSGQEGQGRGQTLHLALSSDSTSNVISSQRSSLSPREDREGWVPGHGDAAKW